MNRLLSISLFLCVIAPNAVQAQFEGMKYRVPSDANTIVLINAEKMFGSAVADRDRWEAKRKAAYDAGILALPPDGTEVLLAGRTDLEFGSSIWELAMLKLREDRNVATVAQLFGGEIDQVSGRSATRLPGDHYVVQLMSNLLASYTPANRQDVARWLRSTDVGASSDLPPYLEQAFGYAKRAGTPIVMAMDVSGTVSPAEIKRRLGTFAALKDAGINTDQLVKLFSGVKGITLGVTLQKKTVGAIRVDFADSPKLLQEVGKPILLEVLRRQGAMIDDFANWTPSISGNTFLLRGTFSEGGTRKVLSVLELPRTLAMAKDRAASPGANPGESQKRIASQQYFKQVTSLLDDLRGKPKRDHVKTFGQAAIWYGKYARKIDQMSILNVDEDLQLYGADMADALRQAEMAMKGVGMRSSVRTGQNQPVSGGYSWSVGGYRAGTGYNNGYGPYGTTLQVGAGRASVLAKGQSDAIIRGQERTRGAANVQQLWQQIDKVTADVRRAMTNKYSANF